MLQTSLSVDSMFIYSEQNEYNKRWAWRSARCRWPVPTKSRRSRCRHRVCPEHCTRTCVPVRLRVCLCVCTCMRAFFYKCAHWIWQFVHCSSTVWSTVTPGTRDILLYAYTFSTC